MPELRKDPVTENWSIIATERSKRPSDFKRTENQKGKGNNTSCPFCPGNESMTPPEVFSLRKGSTPDSPGWSVRVVPNKFPALAPGNADLNEDSLWTSMDGTGVHEVIIEGTDHEIDFADQSTEQAREIVLTWQTRIQEHSTNKQLVYPQLFKNVGAVAGASLEHPHSQLIITPMAPRAVVTELEGFERFYQENGRCVFCEMITREEDSGERLIQAGEHFVVIAPYASRFPFEAWVIPRNHLASFSMAGNLELNDLAEALKNLIGSLEKLLDHPPYNLVLHTAPYHSPKEYHWHFELLPRLTLAAGFELGTGYYINPTKPEEAAAFLAGKEG